MKHDSDLAYQSLLAIKKLKERISELEGNSDRRIGIVGSACRLPGGVWDIDGLWRSLLGKKVSAADIPPERWGLDGFYGSSREIPGRSLTKKGSFIDHPFAFDSEFFGISPKECRKLDPQQRILLETTWHAFEDANIPPSDLKGKKVGVFIGIGPSEYALEFDPAALDVYQLTGNHGSFAAGRISFVFGFKGPSYIVDTACSSSLVAIHQACQSLRTGECDMAIAGGVQMLLSPKSFVALSSSGALSPDGTCKTFLDNADGYGRGEGCGILLLKRMDQLQKQDKVSAIIRSSAVNHDGASSGLTVPNGLSQRYVMEEALFRGRVEPDAIGYVEAHGTGTKLGDPIELNAINEAYCRDRIDGGELRIGSVKASLGHLESASGIAGVLKIIAMMKHGQIPPQPAQGEMNSELDWEKLRLKVPFEPENWNQPSGRRKAAVSSFGLSGTNVHMILEDERIPMPEEDVHGSGWSPPIFVSGKTPGALADNAKRYAEALQGIQPERLHRFCCTSVFHRTHFKYRKAFLPGPKADLIDSMRRFADGQEGAEPREASASIVFSFGWSGKSAYEAVARLCEVDKDSADALRELEEPFRSHFGISVRDSLTARGQEELLRGNMAVFQALGVFLQLINASFWESCGIMPGFLSGYGTGIIGALLFGESIRRSKALELLKPIASACETRSLQDFVRMDHSRWSREIRWAGFEPGRSRIPFLLSRHGNADVADEAALLGRLFQAEAGLSDESSGAGPGSTIAFGQDLVVQVMPSSFAQNETGGGSIAINPLAGQMKRIFESGGEFDRPALKKAFHYHVVDLPRYAFQRKEYRMPTGRGIAAIPDPSPQRPPIRWDDAFMPTLESMSRDLIAKSLLRICPEKGSLENGSDAGLKELCGVCESQMPLFRHLVALYRKEGASWGEASGGLPDFLERVPETKAAERKIIGFVHRVASELPGVLRGERDPLELLFAPSGKTTLEQVYREFPGSSELNGRIADALSEICRRDHPKPVRILEVGAGTGGTTGFVLPALPPGSYEYFFTDIAPSIVEAGKRRFSGFAGIRYGILDIGKPAGSQGFAGESFDVVIASNVVHVTSDIRKAVRNVNSLLRDGGAFIIAESVRQRMWLDVTFGMLKGWWSFFGDESRPSYPLLSVSQWAQVFRSCGFDEASALGVSPEDPDPDQAVLLSRKTASCGIEAPSAALRSEKPGEPDNSPPAFYEMEWNECGPEGYQTGAGSWIVIGSSSQSSSSAVSGALMGMQSHEIPFQRLIDEGAEGFYLEIAGKIRGLNAPGIIMEWPFLLGSDEGPGYAGSIDKPVFAAANFLQRLAAGGFRAPVWIVTRNAFGASGGCGADPLQAVATGMQAVAGLEFPNLAIGLIDLPDTIDACESDLFRSILRSSDRSQFLIRRGKILKRRLRAISEIPVSAPVLEKKATAIVTGGLRGLGLSTADWLAAQGVEHIVLVGRSYRASEELEILKSRTRVTVRLLDIGDLQAVQALVREVDAPDSPLRYIVHSAGVLDDRLIRNMTLESIQGVFHPKIRGALNLHLAVKGKRINAFVMFSSMASMVRTEGQCNYASANCFLDALSSYRRAEGLPSISINWGAMEPGRMIPGERRLEMERIGVRGITKDLMHWALGKVFQMDRSQIGFANVDWKSLVGRSKQRIEVGALPDSLSARESSPEPVDTKGEAGVPDDGIEEWLMDEIRTILMMGREDALHPGHGLFEVGMDSLSSVELIKRINHRLGVDLTTSVVYEHSTIHDLSEFLGNLPKP